MFELSAPTCSTENELWTNNNKKNDLCTLYIHTQQSSGQQLRQRMRWNDEDIYSMLTCDHDNPNIRDRNSNIAKIKIKEFNHGFYTQNQVKYWKVAKQYNL